MVVAVVAAAVVAVAAAALPKSNRTIYIEIYIHVHATRACIGLINLHLPVHIPANLFKCVFVVVGVVPFIGLSYGSLFKVLLGAHIRYVTHIREIPYLLPQAGFIFILGKVGQRHALPHAH